MEHQNRNRLLPTSTQLSQLPWWLFVAILIGLFSVYRISTDAQLLVIFTAISRGIKVTLGVTVSAYLLALVIGLILGMARVSKNKIVYNIASFYVEIVRGIPMLVLLIYIAFVVVPMGVSGLNQFGAWLMSISNEQIGHSFVALTTRDISNTSRVVIGLGMAYGAFSAEIFRAGIESIEIGQMEAARALGMSYFQAMRYVILPQAIRRVLPAMGNDFVAMVKDSALVSTLGVQDITQLAKLYAASTFLFFQTYSILALIYLFITVLLTRGVRYLEKRLGQHTSK